MVPRPFLVSPLVSSSKDLIYQITTIAHLQVFDSYDSVIEEVSKNEPIFFEPQVVMHYSTYFNA